ncbi:MAG TPA: hypothetical protein VMW41_03340 [Candidatus Bathyarchaeia archaeon]|nr:hypothetical protein [Candidatus Bathyarchaeia archaeon]
MKEKTASWEELKPLFRRSLKDVIFSDYLETLSYIRELYIPGYSSLELKDFSEALVWATENLGAFQAAGFIGPGLTILPKMVQIHESCISFLSIYQEELSGCRPTKSIYRSLLCQPLKNGKWTFWRKLSRFLTISKNYTKNPKN